MSNFVQNAFLQARLPVFHFKRFRGKINIQRPRQPHYERARVIAVTTPIYPEEPLNKNCFKASPFKQQAQVVNPYNEIIAREVRNWLNHSKMVGIFHENSITSDDIFKVKVALHKQNMSLKSYGLAIIKKAVQDTKFEAILPLFNSHHCIVFSAEQKVAQLLKITRKVPQLLLIGGIVENKLMSRNEFMNFATMPNLEGARSELVSVLNSAAGQIVNNLETHQNHLVNMLDVYAKSTSNSPPNSSQLADDKRASLSADRDAGFCSGSSEAGDELSSMDHSRLEPHSPTDASEDSVEVKVTPITFTRNKRKSTEPSRVICEQETGPLKKRIRYVPGQYKQETDTKNHFRPWDRQILHETMPNPAEVLVRHPGVTTLHRAPTNDTDDTQDEPLALVAKKPIPNINLEVPPTSSNCHDSLNELNKNLSTLHHASGDCDMPLTVHSSGASGSSNAMLASVPLRISTSSSSSSVCSQRPQQRNYKNMTRERRIEANARERTRVHTISAAYDTLRRSIPSYSHTQKLSKLSVLRVACSYILTLSRMAGFDYSEDQSSPSLAECIDMVTKTIQTEGKIRKKKDE